VSEGSGGRNALDNATEESMTKRERALSGEKNLAGANLAGADLTGANLRGVNLRGADLTAVWLLGVDLTGVDLRGADLTGADLRDVKYDETTRWPDGFTPPAGKGVRHANG
jgi:uncharacterized protein YjbI with pentapeptide repeats